MEERLAVGNGAPRSAHANGIVPWSFTKTIIAAAALVLVQQARLSLISRWQTDATPFDSCSSIVPD